MHKNTPKGRIAQSFLASGGEIDTSNTSFFKDLASKTTSLTNAEQFSKIGTKQTRKMLRESAVLEGAGTENEGRRLGPMVVIVSADLAMQVLVSELESLVSTYTYTYINVHVYMLKIREHEYLLRVF
jgi:hypothetical protein